MLANKNIIYGTAKLHDPADLHRPARNDFMLFADVLFPEQNTRCLTRQNHGVASSIHCGLPGLSGGQG